MKRCMFTIIACVIAIPIIAQIVEAARENNLRYEVSYGFKDINGKWIVKPQYCFTYWYKDWQLGTFENEGGESKGLLDKWGKIIFPTGKYKKYYVSHNLIEVTDLNGLIGITTLEGKILVPCKYSNLYIDSESRYIKATAPNGKMGFFKMDGTEWVPCRYSNLYIDSELRYIMVTAPNGKMGFLKMDGTEWVPCKYNDLYIDSESRYIMVTDTNGKKGLLKKDGTELIPCEYMGVYVYKKSNFIKVKKNSGDEGWFSLDGKVIVPCVYSAIKEAAEEIYLVNKGGEEQNSIIKGGKWGYYANGKEIIPCEYDQASIFKNDVATVKKDGEVKLIKNPLKDSSKIQIAESASPSNKKKIGGPAVSRYPAPDSDVDKNIPTTKKQAENTFAFIIANENYADAPVPYSLNDGRMFKEYCQKTLGLPEKNINLYEDATFGNIITAVEKMKSVADAYDGDASIIFYYAGHGFPDESQATAYLLPVDGDASSIKTTGYSLAKLYKEISNMRLKSAVVFLDACFSGAKREDQMLSQSRAVAIKVKEEAPQGKMVVFSAAQGDETAHQMEEKHHGLFTYFLLKELQCTGGDVDLGTLTEYVTKQVKRQSVVINNKKQTPTVIPSQTLVNSWQNLKLK